MSSRNRHARRAAVLWRARVALGLVGDDMCGSCARPFDLLPQYAVGGKGERCVLRDSCNSTTDFYMYVPKDEKE